MCVVQVYGFALRVCAQTPSLADVAAKEKARRAALTETSKVYTNDDLRGGLGLTTGSMTPEIDRVSPPAPDTPTLPPG